MIFHHLYIAAMVTLSAAGSSTSSPQSAGYIPTGVTFHRDTIFRSDAHGDNWCITWAADDSQITSMDDGNWLRSEHSYHIQPQVYHVADSFQLPASIPKGEYVLALAILDPAGMLP